MKERIIAAIVIDRKDKKVVGKYKTREGAMRARDRMDNEYGAVRYQRMTVDNHADCSRCGREGETLALVSESVCGECYCKELN